MKLYSSKGKDINFDEGGTLGSGTAIVLEDARIVLEPGSADIIFLAQIGEKLQIRVNDDETITLNPIESRALQIRGNKKNVIADESLGISVVGLTDRPGMLSSSARSAGFNFRRDYKRWKLQQQFENTDKDED